MRHQQRCSYPLNSSVVFRDQADLFQRLLLKLLSVSNMLLKSNINRWTNWMVSPLMMTSSNGNFFRVTDTLCGEFPSQRPVTSSFDIFFDLSLNKRLSKQSWGWWFETPLRSLWRHCDVMLYLRYRLPYQVARNCLASWLNNIIVMLCDL